MATTIYRRKRDPGYQEWHYNRRCTHFPQGDYETSYSEPRVGRICAQCKRLEEKAKAKQW